MSDEQRKALVEELADIEHQRWADWQSWCHKVLRENCPSPELEKVLERWDRQIATPYADLSEREKQSDRDQVERYMPIIDRLLAAAVKPEPAALCRCGHPESDHYKYILNGAETWSCKSCDPTSGLAGDQELSGDAWEQRMAADHPYEPTRAVPEPDAYAIERAAKAMFEAASSARYGQFLDEDFSLIIGKDDLNHMARAVLQAAAVEPEPGLDELLDSVHPRQGVSVGPGWGSKYGARFGANIYFQYSVDPKDGQPLMANVTGTGPTRIDAIADAVRQAKENGDG